MIDIPDPDLGDLGRLIVAWANAQRFPPTQVQLARELGVSKQQVSNWLRGDFKRSLFPGDLASIARMVAGPSDDVEAVSLELLNAMLRDIGLLPKAGRVDRPLRRASGK